jgi:hypothetical protein
MPDPLDDPRLFEQGFSVGEGGDVKFTVVNGNTIIFDSFSKKDEVEKRNEVSTNLSKSSDKKRRFKTKFNVAVDGVVTAVLNPDTVKNYRIVDKNHAVSILPSDKRPEHVKRPEKRSENEDSGEIFKKKRTYDSILTDSSTAKADDHGLHFRQPLVLPSKPVNPFENHSFDFRPKSAISLFQFRALESSWDLSDASDEIVSGVRDEGIAISALQDLFKT